ncbi:MAG: argininosuccinate lyase [Thermodesulfobacteriota bacterium]
MRIERLWGGRFKELPTQDIIEFLSGRDVKGIPPADERLIPYDLWGTEAHVLMLYRQGLLTKKEGKKILRGLKDLESLYFRGRFKIDPSYEDIHSQVEAILIERIGIDYGGKIHTGRSRNDQIALDIRLYLRDQALEEIEGLVELIEVLLQRAWEHRRTLMPGYTHHQYAMVTTFGHLLLSFGEALLRDAYRFIHWFDLFNKNPLGSGAGYGTSFFIDRKLTSKLLGFDTPTENATDSITQRWEPEAELAFALAVTMNHLSTMAQTFILLSTREFNMIHLNDRHCSGSSIMPQKRNPCSLEVIKAKASFSHGVVVSLLSVGKALFMGYNRDTQWTKYWIMDLIDETKPALSVMKDILRLLQVNPLRMEELARGGFIGAPLLMEWIVRSFHLPLRKAKMVLEKAVRYTEEEGKEEVSYKGLKKALIEMKLDLPISEREVEEIQKPERILDQASPIGAPSHQRIEENYKSLQEREKRIKKWLIEKKRKVAEAKRRMKEIERQIIF